MQHTQDADGIAKNPVGSNVRRAIDDQFTRSLNASGAAYSRHLDKSFDGVFDPIVNEDGGVRTICLDVIENCDSIGESEYRPFKEHDLASSLPPCGCTPPRKMRFHLVMGNRWAGIV